MGIQHVAAEQNARFSLANYGADQAWRQIVDLNLGQENGKFHHVAGESLKRQSAVLDQADGIDGLARKHGPMATSGIR